MGVSLQAKSDSMCLNYKAEHIGLLQQDCGKRKCSKNMKSVFRSCDQTRVSEDRLHSEAENQG